MVAVQALVSMSQLGVWVSLKGCAVAGSFIARLWERTGVQTTDAQRQGSSVLDASPCELLAAMVRFFVCLSLWLQCLCI